MADVSKITIGGVTYNIKDEVARAITPDWEAEYGESGYIANKPTITADDIITISTSQPTSTACKLWIKLPSDSSSGETSPVNIVQDPVTKKVSIF